MLSWIRLWLRCPNCLLGLRNKPAGNNVNQQKCVNYKEHQSHNLTNIWHSHFPCSLGNTSIESGPRLELDLTSVRPSAVCRDYMGGECAKARKETADGRRTGRKRARAIHQHDQRSMARPRNDCDSFGAWIQLNVGVHVNRMFCMAHAAAPQGHQCRFHPSNLA